MKKNSLIIFLMGPTNVGKTLLAIELCKKIPFDIISVDSAMIYKNMNIGTSKPSKKKLKKIPHYLINIIKPTEYYSVSKFIKDVKKRINKTIKKKKIPLLVGGSMLYYKLLLENNDLLPNKNFKIRNYINYLSYNIGCDKLYKYLCYIDPVHSKLIHPNDKKRIIRLIEIFLISNKNMTYYKSIKYKKLPYKIYQFALIPCLKELLYNSIIIRFKKMLELGLEKEAYKIFKNPNFNKNLPSSKCIGYNQLYSYFMKKITYEEMIFKSIYATRKLIKKQFFYLKNWKYKINYIYNLNIEKNIKIIKKKIKKYI
ncbi:tRNA dimethylallyltransferase [Candidatus Annandia adelgestsuga]|uniref:tRNA dimethylallyltransferase n=1 Tax=Candidatus Annandia adelgestsuga TaxID=1302411 RepID=A0A3S9J7L4_9ENTR|nr:tRNA (adenosine(37)-N6)-dimethylallyltransferase MiaA [Candidatus Annandia adelgestsuga]AZP36276.1 tRNA dimethylallyltransferase [Candidatus Annandia adelgestsuga]